MTDKPLPIGGVRNFAIQRIRLLTGSGMRLVFGPYHFILIARDGTPERTLDDQAYQRVLDAIIRPMEEIPNVSQKSGQA